MAQQTIYEKDEETHYITEIIGEKVSFISSNSNKKEENNEEVKSVPRNVIRNNDNGKLDFYFHFHIMKLGCHSFAPGQARKGGAV